jgi:hypothetical protein
MSFPLPQALRDTLCEAVLDLLGDASPRYERFGPAATLRFFAMTVSRLVPDRGHFWAPKPGLRKKIPIGNFC